MVSEPLGVQAGWEGSREGSGEGRQLQTQQGDSAAVKRQVPAALTPAARRTREALSGGAPTLSVASHPFPLVFLATACHASLVGPASALVPGILCRESPRHENRASTQPRPQIACNLQDRPEPVLFAIYAQGH